MTANVDPCIQQRTLANERAMSGDIPAAVEHFRAAVNLLPTNSLIHDDLLYMLHFHPGCDDFAIFRELSIWEARHARPLASSIQPHTNDRDPDRRLKVGYVSPEFRYQAESNFVVPLLETHHHDQFEIHCYSSVEKPDELTERIKKCADTWHNVQNLKSADLAEKIRADGIDILVDLTMHMRLSRMLTFARKPAPVQVTWLAYPGGTGLRTMDYRLTDRHLDPPGKLGWYTEQPFVLPDCWICYDPLSQSAVASPRAGGPIVFGSLNHPRKMNDQILRLWARVLARVDNSRMVLLMPAEDHRRRAAEIFASEGVEGSRLEFLDVQPRWQYFRTYDRIDIALDTLPYNGITTTCDALWMGTPVLTLPGQTAAGHAAMGILSTVGLHEFIAASPDRFIELALQLASDRNRLMHLRRTLRRRIETSPLMDRQRFAHNVEDAFRAMWRHWCQRPPTPSLHRVPPETLELYHSHRAAEAEAACDALLREQPLHCEAMMMLALIAAQTGRSTRALELISAAIQIDEKNFVYHRNLGIVLRAMGRYGEAMLALGRSIALEPLFVDAYEDLASCYRARGGQQEADRLMQRAKELRATVVPSSA